MILIGSILYTQEFYTLQKESQEFFMRDIWVCLLLLWFWLIKNAKYPQNEQRPMHFVFATKSNNLFQLICGQNRLHLHSLYTQIYILHNHNNGWILKCMSFIWRSYVWWEQWLLYTRNNFDGIRFYWFIFSSSQGLVYCAFFPSRKMLTVSRCIY